MARKDQRGRNLRQGESQRKDGLYMYRYTDARNGQRRTVYDTDLASLREQERQIAREIEDGIETSMAVKRMTVNELFAKYLETRELSQSTLENYKAMWKCRVKDEIGQMKVVQVKASDVKTFYASMSKRAYSHSTIKLVHNMLYPSFKLAVEDDIIRKNPAKGALMDNGRPPKEKKALTVAEQKTLIDFVEHSPVYRVHLPMIQIMLGTGCRCGELIGLTWQDVDMEKREITISAQLVYKNYGDGCRFHLTTPKTDAGVRVIPMNETVKQALENQRRLNFMQAIPRDVEIEGRKDFIFMSRYGSPLMPNAVNHALENIVNAYNKQEKAKAKDEGRKPELLPRMSAHTMRHTCCTRMAERGVDMKVVQYIMGHANIAVTLEVYDHLTEKTRIEKEISKLADTWVI